MSWLAVSLILAILVFYFNYRRSQVTTIVSIEDHTPAPEGDMDAIEYFWRPGCPFCARLGSGLRSAGIPMNERNIWENPADAEIVRSIAGGNETVPTVIIGSVGLVNPSVKEVQTALAEHAPHLL